MRTYTVHERPAAAGADPDFVLVKEGFNWPALFFPVIWLLVRAQWLGLAAYLAGLVAISALSFAFSVSEPAQAALALLYALLVAAEANDWRRWRLSAAGYVFAGVVRGPDLGLAEERWLRANAPATQPPAATPEATDATVSTPVRADGLTPFATPFDRL